MIPRPPISTLFPYTTLFRSDEFVSVTEKLMDELAQCYNVLPQLDINNKLGEHRSEERFSRNAETDLVCRLLLEKKKRRRCVYALRSTGRNADACGFDVSRVE